MVLFADADVLLDAAKQLPAAAALITVVLYFLKHISDDAVRREKIEEKRSEALKDLGDTCHSFQETLARRNEVMVDKIAEVLDRNTAVMARVVSSMDRVENYLDTLNVPKPKSNKNNSV